jgi:DNA-binding response OmpR family regulator
MSDVLLLTNSAEAAAVIVPSLGLLGHSVRVAPATAAAAAGRSAEVILVDGRRDLIRARQLLTRLRSTGTQAALVLVLSERGWPALSAEWAADDVMADGAGPGEVDARIRLAAGRAAAPAAGGTAAEVRSGELVIDEGTYSARIRGRPLDLTFKEFELLKFLAQHPRRVFTRAQLLQEVWGYDYFGGTRTVDVHVRRLRAKLGGDDQLIGTVRNVGYKFEPAAPAQAGQDSPALPGLHAAGTGDGSPA